MEIILLESLHKIGKAGDREMLTALLKVDKIDLELLVSECNYSDDFIKTANDLQILDAISECYEEYKILSRGR